MVIKKKFLIAFIGPVGSGKTYIARILVRKLGAIASPAVFLYGGSVSSKNAGAFLKKSMVQGFLVGQASLKPREFANLVKKAAFR